MDNIYDSPTTSQEGAGSSSTEAATTPSGGRCCACNKILEPAEMGIVGYATGRELGMCRKCASYVNTDEAIGIANSLGAEVYSGVVRPPQPWPQVEEYEGVEL